MEEFNAIYLSIYILGVYCTIIGGVVIAFAFAMGRWIKCIKDYIKTGDIDNIQGSFFFGENNWFYGRDWKEMMYYNNPWIVLIDIGSVSIGIAILALIWPISIVVISTITYAIIARAKFKKKKEFVDRLAGEHA